MNPAFRDWRETWRFATGWPAGLVAGVIALAGIPWAGAQEEEEEPVSCVEIRGVVWEDVNKNGVRDPGEPRVEGVGVILQTDPYTAFTPCSTASPNLWINTNAAGEYSLFMNAYRPYRIQVVGHWPLKFSYAFTRSDVGEDDTIDSDVAEQGEHYGMTDWMPPPTASVTSGVDVGLVRQLSGSGGATGWVRGRTFLAQADGTRPEEGGALAGVQVALMGPDGVVVHSLLTDAAGAYAMEAPAGTYRLHFSSPNRRVPTSHRFAGGDPGRDSDIDVSGFVYPFILPAGEVVDHLDAGYLSIHDVHFSVWQDLDGNGVREGNEPPIAGIKVQLWGEGGLAHLEEKTTSATGSVFFVYTGPPRSFRIKVLRRTVRDSYSPFAAGDDPARDSDVYTDGAEAGFTPRYTLDPYRLVEQAGQAGIVSRPSVQRLITGKVFQADVDGYEREGGSGLGQARVSVERLNPDTLTTTAVASALSGPTGFFSIPVPFETPGVVRLSVSTSSMTGHWQASPRPGAPGGTRLANQLTSSGHTEWVSLPEGGGWFDVGLGLALTVPLRGRVWHDANANGVQDAGEEGVGGVALTARSSDFRDQTWEAVSQASGEFEFAVPGTARVRFGALRPHLDDQFSPRWVGDPTRDSDVRTEGESIGWTEEFTVPADGMLAAGYDVGLIYAPPPRVTHPLHITRTERTPDGTFRFLLLGTLGGTYQVETFQRGATPPWIPVGEPFVTTELETLVPTPNTGDPAGLFYRVRRLH